MADAGRPFYRKLPFLIALIAIFLVGVGVGVYFYLQSTGQGSIIGNTANKNDEVRILVEKVGKLYDLPQGEVPTIATVSDIAKLSQQEFFKRAQNGDKVLIYTKAKKAILYRPSTNKIIEIGPVNIDETQANQQATGSAQPGVGSPTPAKELRVALYNGTTTTGLTRRLETRLGTYKDVATEVVTRENAAKQDYTQTVVIDLANGRNKDAASKLSSLIKGSRVVNAVPAGEPKPTNTDILIILGSDFATTQ